MEIFTIMLDTMMMMMCWPVSSKESVRAGLSKKSVSARSSRKLSLQNRRRIFAKRKKPTVLFVVFRSPVAANHALAAIFVLIMMQFNNSFSSEGCIQTRLILKTWFTLSLFLDARLSFTTVCLSSRVKHHDGGRAELHTSCEIETECNSNKNASS